jgi:hypothetical protein
MKPDTGGGPCNGPKNGKSDKKIKITRFPGRTNGN